MACIWFFVRLALGGTNIVLYSDTKTVEPLPYSSRYTIPVSKSLSLCRLDLFMLLVKPTLNELKLKYSYMSVDGVVPVEYFIASVCKVKVVCPEVALIANPCCATLLVIELMIFVNTQPSELGATNPALNLSVRDMPSLAVPIGSKFVPCIVPIAFSKSAELTKSKTFA